ncbi:MAG: SDR family oxidoreductase [Albidovulum sp.]|nr:SDR family oxidoreductase [Albidovulum sp.]MDE0307776.1 SDR family oxidoreductase [Albidovulum sp.]
MESAIVTGASSGIGAAIVEALSREDVQVTAIARRGNLLAELARRTGCDVAVADVGDLSATIPLVERLRPEILVNNAGIGLGIFGISSLSREDIERSISTNISAPVQMTRAAIPHMLRAGKGHIVNIGSITGLHTLTSAVYGAGKGAVHRFSQNLRNELLGTGIRVSEICPGRVLSEFYDSKTGNIEEHEDSSVDVEVLQPEDVAEAVLFALRAPRHVNISTIELLPTSQVVGGSKFAES